MKMPKFRPPPTASASRMTWVPATMCLSCPMPIRAGKIIRICSPSTQGGGFIWAACHAVSALENVDDPGDPDSDPDMNFLSEHALVLWGDHGDGTPPYQYNNSEADNPIMQFMGNVDSATQNGSEQIYLPDALGWRPTTTIVGWDPDHPDIPGVSPGEAAVFAYGRGFGNPEQWARDV